MDLYQPSGMGRRRRRRSDDEGHKGQIEYFYPVAPSIKPVRRNNSRILGKDDDSKSAAFKDNVGVTVIMPGGKLEVR